MFFKVTDITRPPQFVAPTPPNNQEYTIYVGGDFHVNVYARPTHMDRYSFMTQEAKLCFILMPHNEKKYALHVSVKTIYVFQGRYEANK